MKIKIEALVYGDMNVNVYPKNKHKGCSAVNLSG